MRLIYLLTVSNLRTSVTHADCKLSETRTLAAQWAAHQLANRVFAEKAMRHYQDGDIVWVQDYHLMLLPAILKEKKPRMKVGNGEWRTLWPLAL